MREKRIYLLLTDTGTMFTKLIKAYTKMPYNHASIAFDSELKEVYSFGRKTVKNPFIGGFVKEDLNSILFQKAKCAIYSLTVTEEQFQEMKRCIQEIERQKENYHYHLLGLIGVMLNKPIKRKHAFFCSQFVATIFNKSKIIDLKIDPALMKPSDLPNTADFHLIFEGELIDYLYRRIDRRVASSHPVISI